MVAIQAERGSEEGPRGQLGHVAQHEVRTRRLRVDRVREVARPDVADDVEVRREELPHRDADEVLAEHDAVDDLDVEVVEGGGEGGRRRP